MADSRDARRPPAYQQRADEVVAALGTDAYRGLSGADARARLERRGRNELAAERPVPAWRKLLAQFRDALVILLVVATAISARLWLSARRRCLTRPWRSSGSSC